MCLDLIERLGDDSWQVVCTVATALVVCAACCHMQVCAIRHRYLPLCVFLNILKVFVSVHSFFTEGAVFPPYCTDSRIAWFFLFLEGVFYPLLNTTHGLLGFADHRMLLLFLAGAVFSLAGQD